MSLFGRWSGNKNQQKEKTSKGMRAAVKVAQKSEEGAEEKKEKIIPDKEKSVATERPIAVVKNIKFPAYKILSKPIITEKTTYLVSGNTYTFNVDAHTNKSEVKKAVEAVYGVKVIKVRMLKKAGKVMHFGRMEGKRKNLKKAYVTLAKGQQIEIHKNI